MVLVNESKFKVDDLFSGLSREEDGNVDREIEVNGNPRLEEIIRGFNEVLKGPSINLTGLYEVCSIFSKKEYRSKEITLFSISLKDYENMNSFRFKTSIYLSALINKSSDNEFNLNLQNLSFPLDYFGYKNCKKIIVSGDFGDYLGQSMEGGEINVKGNSGVRVGCNMNGGRININYLTDCVGDKMISGEINIFGFANCCVGHEMIGGTINLFGDYRYICDNIHGGNIFHRGRQIIKDGKEVPGANIKWA